MLDIARRTIHNFLIKENTPSDNNSDPEINRKQGAFVTLFNHDKLRGCVGHTKDDLPLRTVVGLMALQAAFNDYRFSSVTLEELPHIEIEISILSPSKKIRTIDEIEVGTDGIMLRIKDRHGLFLPQVPAKMGWDRIQLLERLCDKIGVPNDSWRKNAELFTFQTEVFDEIEFK